MAKKSAIERNNKRKMLVAKYDKKRAAMKESLKSDELNSEEKFSIRLKLAAMPRNSSPTRVRNRCVLTGRPRGYYRTLGLSRIALRDLGSSGAIPGMIKASW